MLNLGLDLTSFWSATPPTIVMKFLDSPEAHPTPATKGGVKFTLVRKGAPIGSMLMQVMGFFGKRCKVSPQTLLLFLSFLTHFYRFILYLPLYVEINYLNSLGSDQLNTHIPFFFPHSFYLPNTAESTRMHPNAWWIISKNCWSSEWYRGPVWELTLTWKAFRYYKNIKNPLFSFNNLLNFMRLDRAVWAKFSELVQQIKFY